MRPLRISLIGTNGIELYSQCSGIGHVDVLAAVSGPAWVEGVNIHFYHTLTKVTFTFKKVAPAPDVVTIEKIEFRKCGDERETDRSRYTAATTEHNKPDFIWSDVTTETSLLFPLAIRWLLMRLL